MPLLGVKGADHFAILVSGAVMPRDVDHRWRVNAAIGNRRIELRFDFDTGEVVRTIVDPNVVVLIYSQARDAAHLPLVRQGFGPTGIHFEFRRGLGLSSQPAVKKPGRKKNRTNSQYR